MPFRIFRGEKDSNFTPIYNNLVYMPDSQRWSPDFFTVMLTLRYRQGLTDLSSYCTKIAWFYQFRQDRSENLILLVLSFYIK